MGATHPDQTRRTKPRQRTRRRVTDVTDPTQSETRTMKLRTSHRLSAGVLVLLGLLLLTTQVRAETLEEEARRLFCCKENKAECLACAAGQTEKQYCENNIRARKLATGMFGCRTTTCKKVPGCGKYVEEYCKKNQHVSGCEKYKICCTANDARCNACAADLTEEQYCEKNPFVQGCDKYHKKSCCKANNAECNACALDMTEEKYCNFHPYVSGCEKYKSCCRAHDAKCLACAADQTEEQYCQKNQHVPGCDKYRDDGQGGVDFGGKKGCCKANTAECRACQEGKSVKHFCKKRRNRDTPGCERDSKKDRGNIWDRLG